MPVVAWCELMLLTPVAPANISCRFEYAITNTWQGGFIGTIKVTNSGSVTAEDWRLEFDLTPGNALITKAWDGLLISFHNPVRVDAPSWNNYLHPGRSYELGFLGEIFGQQSSRFISNVRLNGVSCAYT